MYSHYWFCGNFSLALYLIIYLSPWSLLVLLFQDVCHEFLPLNGNHFTIFVCGNTQHGVVGLQGALITCFTSDYQVHTCEYVTKVTESEEGMEHEMPDFLVDFFAERQQPRRKYSPLWKMFYMQKCLLLVWCCLPPAYLPPAQSVHLSALISQEKANVAMWR